MKGAGLKTQEEERKNMEAEEGWKGIPGPGAHREEPGLHPSIPGPLITLQISFLQAASAHLHLWLG
jgi:hypothetical protein